MRNAAANGKNLNGREQKLTAIISPPWQVVPPLRVKLAPPMVASVRPADAHPVFESAADLAASIWRLSATRNISAVAVNVAPTLIIAALNGTDGGFARASLFAPLVQKPPIEHHLCEILCIMRHRQAYLRIERPRLKYSSLVANHL